MFVLILDFDKYNDHLGWWWVITVDIDRNYMNFKISGHFNASKLVVSMNNWGVVWAMQS